MKRVLYFLFFFAALLGCSSPVEKTNPLIEQYVLEHMANPDTYKPGKTETYAQGSIDVADTQYWQNIPNSGRIDVVVLRHEFSIADPDGNPSDNVFYFYMNPALDMLYYAHKEKGFLLFELDE